VLQNKASIIVNNIAKVIIKSEKTIPFVGIFHVIEQFGLNIGNVINKELGLRCFLRLPVGLSHACELSGAETLKEIARFKLCLCHVRNLYPKDTKMLGHNKARAYESLGFV